jgi:hypothetical protein
MIRTLILIFLLVTAGCGGSSIPTVNQPIKETSKIACWGDSMTAGSYPGMLSNLTGLVVFNGGVGGQGSNSIAIRQGGVGLTISVADGVIPTYGPVPVTSKSGLPVTSQGGGPLYGWLAGIYGNIGRVANPDNSINDYVFTRATSGTSAPCPDNSTFTVDRFGRDSDITVIWSGRNNFGYTSTIVADIQAMVALLKFPKRFAVLSICNGSGEVYAGSSLKFTNDALLAAFSDNYCDVRSAVVAGYDPSNPQDINDHAIDTTPSSLRVDGNHLNAAGNTIIANSVYAFLKAKGFIN